MLSALEPWYCPLTMLELDINNCQTPGLQPGDLCEGDGECGASPRVRVAATRTVGCLGRSKLAAAASPRPFLGRSPARGTVPRTLQARGVAATVRRREDPKNAGTDTGLDNCDDADMYVVRGAAPVVPSQAPTLVRLDDTCPVLRAMRSAECEGWTAAQINIDNCATEGLVEGDACEGDGECGTAAERTSPPAWRFYVLQEDDVSNAARIMTCGLRP